MARFFLPQNQIQNNRGTITGDELEHLKKVLRLRPGDAVTIFDDAGREHEGIIRAYGRGRGEIEIVKSYQAGRESSLEATLALGLTKGEKIDFVVEKATELGVHAIAPFVSAHTVPRLDRGKIDRRRERWQKIALSAAKQSGRTRIPEILPLSDFAALIRKPWSCSLKLLFWEQESRQTLNQIRETPLDPPAVVLFIGPEGGFSTEEASQAIAHGFQPIRLGNRILRAESAAIAVLSIVQFLWGDLG